MTENKRSDLPATAPQSCPCSGPMRGVSSFRVTLAAVAWEEHQRASCRRKQAYRFCRLPLGTGSYDADAVFHQTQLHGSHLAPETHGEPRLREIGSNVHTICTIRRKADTRGGWHPHSERTKLHPSRPLPKLFQNSIRAFSGPSPGTFPGVSL